MVIATRAEDRDGPTPHGVKAKVNAHYLNAMVRFTVTMRLVVKKKDWDNECHSAIPMMLSLKYLQPINLGDAMRLVRDTTRIFSHRLDRQLLAVSCYGWKKYRAHAEHAMACH